MANAPTNRWWKGSAAPSTKSCPLAPPPTHGRLITPVTDRPGHDRRYAIDPTRISTELRWQPRHSLEQGLAATVRWYLEQQGWCQRVRQQGGYTGGRLGMLAGAGAN